MRLFKRYLSLFLLAGTVATALIISIGSASAESLDQPLSDALYVSSKTGEYPICVKESIPVRNLTFNDKGSYDGVVSACVTHGEKFDYATGSSLNLVRFNGQEKFTKVTNSYSLFVGSDPEVASLRYDGINAPSRSQPYIGITQNLSQALTPQLWVDDAGNTQLGVYTLDMSKFTWITDGEGNKVQVAGVSLSNNGRFVAYADQNYKLSLLDRDENTTKVIAENIRYGKGTYSEPQFGAVSNNGRLIYIDGYERMYDTHNCPMNGVQCHYVENVDYRRSGMRASQAYFDELNEKLLLQPQDGVLNLRYHEIDLKGYLKDPNESNRLEYLALGDSYSSGEGDLSRNEDTGEKFYRAHTDDDGTAMVDGFTNKVRPKEECHLSTNSYPYHLAQGMGLGEPSTNPSITKWQSVTCSGATAWDLKGQGSNDYEGQGDGDGPRLEGYNVNSLKTQALNEFIPGRQKQIEFVKKYQPKVITLTAGGNDINFGGKLKECVIGLETCSYAKEEWRGKLKNEIYDQFDNLSGLYEELSRATNDRAKIYVVGYPVFINADPSSACNNTLFLDLEEREMIVNSILYLNNVIQAAARKAGVTYLDIEHAFDDHRLCDSDENHVNAITGVFGYNGNEEQESFHPNSMGHVDMTNAIWDDVDGQSLVNYETCASNGQKVCPDKSITASNAVVPPYFQEYDTKDNTFVHYYTLTNGTLIKSTQHYNVKTERLWYEPDSKVDITLYSNPTKLGTFKVDDEGRITASIIIPSSVPAGYHRLVVSGKSSDGRPVEIYQTVLIQSSNTDDIDEDGVLDSQDSCAFGLPITMNTNMASLGCLGTSSNVQSRTQVNAKSAYSGMVFPQSKIGEDTMSVSGNPLYGSKVVDNGKPYSIAAHNSKRVVAHPVIDAVSDIKFIIMLAAGGVLTAILFIGIHKKFLIHH